MIIKEKEEAEMPSFDWFVYRGGVISRLFTPLSLHRLGFHDAPT